MNENRNLVLPIVLSAAVLFGWEYFFAKPQMERERAAQSQLTHAPKAQQSPGQVQAPQIGAGTLGRAEALKQGGARVAIETPAIDGSLLLKGGRFDDLRLRNYRETTDPKS